MPVAMIRFGRPHRAAAVLFVATMLAGTIFPGGLAAQADAQGSPPKVGPPPPFVATVLKPADIAIAVKLRDRLVQGSEAFLIAESLTSEVGPRMAGSANDARAVAWAQAKFKELKFDKVWVQPVTYPKWVRRSESAEVLAPFPQSLRVNALGYSKGTGATPIEAEVVEYSTLAALQAAHADDVRGRIVYIGNRMERYRDGSGYGLAVTARSGGATVASKLGAVALLIRSIGTDNNRLPHTGMGLSLSTALADSERVAAAPRSASGLPLIETEIPAAAISNPDADLLSHLLERGRPVRIRLALDVGLDDEAHSHNVIGELTGTTRRDEIVLAGAHLDSWDLGTGALDDAAGIGITAAAVFHIGKLQDRPARTLRVVAFANEEQGIWGGKAYAEAALKAGEKHVLVGESDFGADRVYALRAGTGSEAQPVMREIAAALAPVGVEWSDAPGAPGSDITALVAQGMPWFVLAQDGSTLLRLSPHRQRHHRQDRQAVDRPEHRGVGRIALARRQCRCRLRSRAAARHPVARNALVGAAQAAMLLLCGGISSRLAPLLQQARGEGIGARRCASACAGRASPARP